MFLSLNLFIQILAIYRLTICISMFLQSNYSKRLWDRARGSRERGADPADGGGSHARPRRGRQVDPADRARDSEVARRCIGVADGQAEAGLASIRLF